MNCDLCYHRAESLLTGVVTGRMPPSGKLPVLNLLTGQKISIFAQQRRVVAPIHVKFGATKAVASSNL